MNLPSAPDSPDLATTAWFVALGYEFRVRADPELVAHIDAAFVSLRHPSTPVDGHTYRLEPSAEVPERNDLLTLFYDEERLLQSPSRGYLYSYLWWHVNRAIIDPCTSHLLLHASCAADGERAVVLPAHQDSGKTTTVAGLVASGLSYLTDEATAFRPDGSWIDPMAKPLAIDRGSWEVLAHLAPDVGDGLVDVLGSQWQLPASQIGTVATGGARVALVVSPRYTPDIGVEVEALSPPDALMMLGENAFNLAVFGDDGFRTLERIARDVPAYAIKYSDLDAMVATIRGLLEEAP